MKLLNPLLNALSALWRWLRTARYASHGTFLLSLLALLYFQHRGYHEQFMPVQSNDFTDLPKGWEPLPDGAYICMYFLAYMRLFVFLGGVVYHVIVIRAYPNVQKMVLPTWVASCYLATWTVASSLYDRWEATRIQSIGEAFSWTAYLIHFVLKIGMFMSPPLALMYFQRCKIMERYVMKNFLQPLVFCLLGFFSLWVVMDLKDNLAQFQDNKIPMSQILMFYVKLLPFIYVSVAPVTLLLSTLYSLGKMSRANEIISMLGAGKSMGQVLRPIFIIGAYASFIGMTANYEWAPMAEGNKKTLLQDIQEKMSKNIVSMGLVYRNNEDHRTWFIGFVPYDMRNENLRRIAVRQEDSQGHLVKAWICRSANWWPDQGIWSFYGGAEITYKNGGMVSIVPFDKMDGASRDRVDHSNWSETPWVLMSGSVTPEFLGVPSLLSYITANKTYDARKLAPFWTHFFYRFALPIQCLVIVLIAAPLGVVFSRRGLLGGVAAAVFIFFILLFIDSLFLNMGKGDRLAPWLAPFIPDILLGGVGAVLFYFRSQNRDFPKLTNWHSLVDAGRFLGAGLRDLAAQMASLRRARGSAPVP